MAKQFPLEIVIGAVDKATAKLKAVQDRVSAIGAPVRRLTRTLSALSEQSGLSEVGRQAWALGKTLAAGAAIVVAAGASLLGFAYRASQAADAIGDTAARLNVSTDALQAWTYGFNQADVAPEALTNALDTLNKNLGLAQIGMGKALPLFRGLGIDPKRLKTIDQLLPVLADRLSKIHDPAKRAAIANRLLGDAGAQMALKLAEGPKALEAMTEAARKAGTIIDGSVIESANTLDMRMGSLKATFAGVAGNVLGRLYPALIKIAEGVQAAIVQYQPQIAAFAVQFADKLPGYIEQTVKVLQTLAQIVGTVAAAIVWCNDTFGTTATVIGVLATTIGAGLTAAVGKLAASLLQLGYSFAVAFPIPTLIIAAVAAAVAAGWWLYKNWDKVSDAIGGTIEQIIINFSLAWERVKTAAVSAFEWIIDKLKFLWEHSPLYLAFKGLEFLAGKVMGDAAPASGAAIGGTLLQPGATSKQQVEVKVDLSNLPAGTRTNASASNGMVLDLSRGFAMPGVP